MNKWLSWASRNKWVNLFILLTYYLLVVLPHEVFGVFIASLFKKHGRPFYDRTLLIFFSLVFVVCLIVLAKRICNHPQRSLIIKYLFINTVLAILCFTILFVVNVEAIHFVQYAMFAILAFPLTRNYFQTHIWAMLAGTVDELYQYTILSPERTTYFDFNDVVINMIGAGFGLIAIRIYAPSVDLHSWAEFKTTKLWKLVAFILVATAALFLFGMASYYPEEGSLFVLIKEEITTFWHHMKPAVVFHVLTPLEGIILIVLIFWIFMGIEKGSNAYE